MFISDRAWQCQNSLSQAMLSPTLLRSTLQDLARFTCTCVQPMGAHHSKRGRQPIRAGSAKLRFSGHKSCKVTANKHLLCLDCFVETTFRMAAHTPSVEEIKRKLYPHVEYHLCDFQVESIKAQLKDSDVVTTAATGAGKTAAFYGPLSFDEHGIIVIVTPLNTLGKQIQKQLGRHKLETIHFYKGHASDVDMMVTYNTNIQKNVNTALRDFRDLC